MEDKKVFILLLNIDHWPEGWETKIHSVYDTIERAKEEAEQPRNGSDFYEIVERFVEC